jgi:transcriptional regulator with XRE-family HTH domain
MARFGDVLRQSRMKAGKSLGELARHLGVSVVYMSDVERSRRSPLSNLKILFVSEFLETDPSELLTAAIEDKRKFDLDIADYPPVAIELLSGLARGRRKDETYRKLLDLLKREDEKGDQDPAGNQS